MNIEFVKMHGLGNDFMVVDNTQNLLPCSPDVIQKLANRNIGVGFDQMLVLDKADYQKGVFGYRIFNADGTEVYQCGNGARCMAKYLMDNSLSVGRELILQTKKSRYQVAVELGKISVNMGEPILDPSLIPYFSQAKGPLLTEEIAGYTFGVCSVGNPHAVVIVDSLADFSVDKVGEKFRQSANFPEGVNVGFMQLIDKNNIKLRVYERGVGETLACGSGASAAVVIGILLNKLSDTVTVELLGGPLQISWQRGQGVMMMGGATTVFSGELTKDFFKG